MTTKTHLIRKHLKLTVRLILLSSNLPVITLHHNNLLPCVLYFVSMLNLSWLLNKLERHFHSQNGLDYHTPTHLA